MNVALAHYPCKHSFEMFMFQWQKTCLSAWTCCSSQMEKVGLRGKRDVYILCQLSARGLVQWGIAVQNSICYHMNQPLQNNCVELAEASLQYRGRRHLTLSLLCNPQVQKYHVMENFALETLEGWDRSLRRVWLVPLHQSRRLKGNKLHTGKGASCWLPSCSLLPALWLAEGRFHHPPASCLLRVRSPVGTVYTEHFIHRTQILLNSRVSFCQVIFGSIHQVNLCIILGLLLAHKTAVTEVFTYAKGPLKISSYIRQACCKHLASLTRNKTMSLKFARVPSQPLNLVQSVTQMQHP